MATRLGRQCAAQIRFAAAGGTGGQHVVMLVYPTAAEQVRELALVEHPRVTVIDVLRIRLQLELGLQQEPGHFVIVAIGGFPINQ